MVGPVGPARPDSPACIHIYIYIYTFCVELVGHDCPYSGGNGWTRRPNQPNGDDGWIIRPRQPSQPRQRVLEEARLGTPASPSSQPPKTSKDIQKPPKTSKDLQRPPKTSKNLKKLQKPPSDAWSIAWRPPFATYSVQIDNGIAYSIAWRPPFATCSAQIEHGIA